MKPSITTHVLDTNIGKPAAGIVVRLFISQHVINQPIIDQPIIDQPSAWQLLASSSTNDDGRILSWSEDFSLSESVYRIEFDMGAYFELLQVDYFYPTVTVDFKVNDPQQHFHVPVLVSPFGYSTYRGS